MAVYDNKVLNGEHLSYLIQLIKNADNTVAAGIPDELADLTEDATHRVVTDTEKTTWNGKTTMSAVEAKGYQTASQVTAAINSAIAGLTTFHFEVVQALPTQEIDSNAIYLVPKASGSSGNIYEEWAYVITDNTTSPAIYGWEHIGDTQMSFDTLSNTEIQTIWDNVSAS